VGFGTAVLAAACGSRTPFGVAPSDSDTVVVTDTPCSSDRECIDSAACTLDACDMTAHVCVRTLRDSYCDDGIYCNGEERCVLGAGCLGGSRSCADTVDCTIDSCDEDRKQCVHAPDDTACPISQACDADLGCQARAFAHDDAKLYDVRIPSGEVKEIGPLGVGMTDVALHPSNVLYGISGTALSIVDQKSGKATLSRTIMSTEALNAADVAPDGTLYVAGGSTLFTLDPSNGNLRQVMVFPRSLSSSGDLAFLGERLVGTADGSGDDQLVEFDLTTKRATTLGSIGFRCVWGLAAYGTTLYGLTCSGELLSIDTSTGQGRLLVRQNVGFWGASAR
jgi:hypothetical protein